MTRQVWTSVAASLIITCVAVYVPFHLPQKVAPSPTANQGKGATATPSSSPTMFDDSNPFAHPSTLPFQAPPFNEIKDAVFQPAIEEGMRRELEEVAAIANSPDAPHLPTRSKRSNAARNCCVASNLSSPA